MRHSVIARTLVFVFAGVSLLAIPLAAQDTQDTSVADAARRTREQKKSAAKPATVVTNDTLTPAAASEAATRPEGQPAQTADASAQPATAADSAAAAQAAAASQAEAAKKKSEIAALKQQIAEQQKQADLLLRLYALDQDAFLTKPDHDRDSAGKAKLDSEQSEIHDKVAEVARLRSKLEALAPGESTKPSEAKP
jgi:hypothetical protein